MRVWGTWSGEEKGIRVALVMRSRRVTWRGTTSAGRAEPALGYGSTPDVLYMTAAVGSSSFACVAVSLEARIGFEQGHLQAFWRAERRVAVLHLNMVSVSNEQCPRRASSPGPEPEFAAAAL